MRLSSSLSGKEIIRKKKIIVLAPILLIIIAGFGVYANSLKGEFIWDDYFCVKYNAHIKDWPHLTDIFTETISGGFTEAAAAASFYRPLQMVTYAIDYLFWGLNEFGYHLTNIILHILAGLCFYWLVVKIFKNYYLALLASLFYIVHPVHVEAVASIAGRADSLSAIFILLGAILYIKAGDHFNIFYYVSTLFCFISAIFSKESAIIFPLVLLLYHYVFKKKVSKKLFLPIIGIALSYILFRLFLLSFYLPQIRGIGVIFQRIPVFFAAITNYARILFIPLDLRVNYGSPPFRFIDMQVLIGMFISVSVLFLAFKNKNHDRILLFSVCWFFIFLLPVSNILPINDSFMKEHWLYLPSFGFFLILARGMLLLHQTKKAKILAVFLSAGVFIFYSICTIKQNGYWREPITFMERSIRYLPNYAVFYNELGYEYKNKGRFEQAVRNYKKALEADPNLIGVYYNLGDLYKERSQYKGAIAAYQQALERNPDDISIYYVIVNLYSKVGEAQKAADYRKLAQQQQVKLVQKYYNMGNDYKGRGENKKAIVSYEKALGLNPDNILACNELAGVFIILGQYNKAIALLEQAEKNHPSFSLAQNSLALAYYYKRNYDLAIKHCDKAIKLGYKVSPKLLGMLAPYRK
ncbi:MAG: tetratricopeptide repeat protein [Candidatus Omnitrophota bacterium]